MNGGSRSPRCLVFSLVAAVCGAPAATPQSCEPQRPLLGSPGGDNPDEYAGAGSGSAAGLQAVTFEGSGSEVSTAFTRVGVWQGGYFQNASLALERVGIVPIIVDQFPPGLGNTLSVVFIPSGGLYGLSRSDQFRAEIESYVRSGGTVIVFTQQNGSDFSVLPTPDGEAIHGYGWFQDNSCFSQGSFIETFHPILSSHVPKFMGERSALVDSHMDGYFDRIPEESIVLLRRVKNGLPVMFMYPYGAGWVIVSASYDDWGGFYQTGFGARAIIRDAIAWAKKPAELPIYEPGGTATVDIQIRNVSDLAASQVKLILLTPSRDRVVAEETVPLSILSGETAQVPFSTNLPEFLRGIYHVDYELLDDGGGLIQLATEEDTGRIAVGKPPEANFRSNEVTVSLVVPGGEDVILGQPVLYRYRISNGYRQAFPRLPRAGIRRPGTVRGGSDGACRWRL
jgi:hypothetical protein